MMMMKMMILGSLSVCVPACAPASYVALALALALALVLALAFPSLLFHPPSRSGSSHLPQSLRTTRTVARRGGCNVGGGGGGKAMVERRICRHTTRHKCGVVV